MPRIRHALRNILHRRAMEQDLDQELQAYLDLLTQENIQKGQPADQARHAALLTLGGVTQVKEQVREVKAGAFLETVFLDLRYTVRTLRASPTFFLVAVLSLALGIGLTTALFSIVNTVLLRALPYPEPARLAFLGEAESPQSHPISVSYLNFADWRRFNHSFETMAAYADEETSITAGDSALRAHFAMVTQDFFQTLRTPPAIGRDFTPTEHHPGAAPSVLISDSLWRGPFASSPDILGRTLKVLGGIRFTIIGVMPPGFDYPNHTQVWDTAELVPEYMASRTAHNFRVIGRLKPGVTLAAAQQDISAIARRLKRQYPGTYMSNDAHVLSLHDQLAGSAKTSLLTLFAAVGLVLLIVCVNIANLLLARASARSHELGIRSSLGASLLRLVRQLLIESFVLALCGGLLGLVLAAAALPVLKFFVPLNIAQMDDVAIDSHVLAFALAVSLLSGLLFGILPAFLAARSSVNESLKQTATQHSATRKTRRTGHLLVVSEVALAFLLLIGTGLLLRNFLNLRRQPVAFEPAHVLTAALSFPVLSLKFDAPPGRLNDYQSIAARVRQLPGVRAVAYASELPLTHGADGHFSIENSPELPGWLSDANYRVVSPDYFHAIGTRLLAGRFFSEHDGPATAPVVIVNSTFAKTVFPHRSALGQRIWFDSFDVERRYMTIVGIVDDIREDALNRPAISAGYVCYSQHLVNLTDTNLVVKTAADPMRLAPAIRKIVRNVNRNVPATFDTLQNVYTQALSQQRFEAQMLALFATVAILLAGIGVYGVLSYLVQQTRTEIGIRIALGATSQSIVSSILARGLRAALLGMLLALPALLAAGRIVSSVLYNVSTFDPITYISAAALLLATVLFASSWPALRATRIQPVDALKHT